MNLINNRINYHLMMVLMLGMVVFLSCKNKKTANVDERTGKINVILGKTFHSPSDIKLYMPFEKQFSDSIGMFNSKLKVFSYINVSCSTCLDELENWSTLATELSAYKIPVILVLQSKDRYELLKYLIEENKLKPYPYPFVFDVNNQYFPFNRFLSEADRLYTVTTTKKDKILYVGDPMHVESDRTKLLASIKELSIKN